MVEDSDDFISKSQRKRDAQALLDLGRQLVDLSPGQLAKVPLAAHLREAVDRVRVTRQRIARKRELQFLAKLLRSEEDVEPLQIAVDAILSPGREETLRLHRIETWRDRLIAEGDSAVTDLVAHHPDVDVQQLRQLIRAARRETQREQPPKSARQLFKVLRSMDDSGPLPD